MLSPRKINVANADVGLSS